MDSEVSALMGAADEELWEKEGFFTLVDEMCKDVMGCSNLKTFLNVNASVSTSTLHDGKKLSFQNPCTTLPTHSSLSIVLGSAEGSGITRKSGGFGAHYAIGEKNFTISTLPLVDRPAVAMGGRSITQRGSVKRPAKVWKLKKTKRRMVMGAYVGLEESYNLSM